jgi:hypothetical protein
VQAKKQKEKELESDKQREYEKMMGALEEAKREDERKKDPRILMKKENLSIVKRQMLEEPRVLAKTGVAIVRSV